MESTSSNSYRETATTELEKQMLTFSSRNLVFEIHNCSFYMTPKMLWILKELRLALRNLIIDDLYVKEHCLISRYII